MKYKAVIFDLFGTLVKIYSRQEYKDGLAKMAAALDIPFSDFQRLWLETDHLRGTGKISTLELIVKEICPRLGAAPRSEQVQAACQVRNNYVLFQLIPREDALPTLKSLKSGGHKLGLLSNCSTEVPTLWGHTPFAGIFDAPVFSSAVGFRKPDPRIYEIALERLKVMARECLFVADGDGGELAAAQSMGMTSVILHIPEENGADSLRLDKEDWHGDAISSLSEVLTLVEN
ncbi:MAG: HAD-IA family hydrolase [Dehalococcoidales bacterium]|nr:HAD-IA family hydrolase [Dehalococcoidales bacterium]